VSLRRFGLKLPGKLSRLCIEREKPSGERAEVCKVACESCRGENVALAVEVRTQTAGLRVQGHKSGTVRRANIYLSIPHRGCCHPPAFAGGVTPFFVACGGVDSVHMRIAAANIACSINNRR